MLARTKPSPRSCNFSFRLLSYIYIIFVSVYSRLPELQGQKGGWKKEAPDVFFEIIKKTITLKVSECTRIVRNITLE